VENFTNDLGSAFGASPGETTWFPATLPQGKIRNLAWDWKGPAYFRAPTKEILGQHCVKSPSKLQTSNDYQ
jgi:hypothetical protein